MARRNEIRKKGACYESCWVYICMYGKKREKLCDFGCVKTGKSCRQYINVYWKIPRYRHYHKTKPEFPTTLYSWKKRENLNF